MVVRRRDHGMVTAETAMVIPVLVALMLILVWMVSLGIAQVRLVDATREAARMTARGDRESVATRLAEKIAPDGTEIEITDSGGVARVRARLAVRPDLPLVGDLGAVNLHAESSSASENGEP
ncbi:MAG: TadE family type IV pilus minor pilin [Nocardioidaceae bacterium]